MNFKRRENEKNNKKESIDIISSPLYYDMSQKGFAVIFNQVNHTDNTIRYGSYEDANRLKTCFEKLNFSVEIKNDLMKSDIADVMEDVRSKTNISCLIIVVLAHGDDENNVSARGGRYRVNILWESLIGRLDGIPKLFFIQACRGYGKDDGFYGYTETDDCRSTSVEKLPLNADILQMFSSTKDFESYRDINGSWFIKELCEALEERADKYNLMELLTFVNNKVASKYATVAVRTDDAAKKQMPQIVCQLSKSLRFNISG